MPPLIDPEVLSRLETRNQDTCERAQAGTSYSEIARLHGISIGTVKNVLKRQGIKLERQSRAAPGRDPRSHDNIKALSRLHRQVGVKLDAFQTFSSGLQADPFALLFNISQPRFRLARLGAHDFTLRVLQTISLQ